MFHQMNFNTASNKTSLFSPDSENYNDSMMEPPRKKRYRENLDHMSPEDKKARRKDKNRQAAQTARDRKRAKIEALEQENERLREENKRLKALAEGIQDHLENNPLSNQSGLDSGFSDLGSALKMSATSPDNSHAEMEIAHAQASNQNNLTTTNIINNINSNNHKLYLQLSETAISTNNSISTKTATNNQPHPSNALHTITVTTNSSDHPKFEPIIVHLEDQQKHQNLQEQILQQQHQQKHQQQIQLQLQLQQQEQQKFLNNLPLSQHSDIYGILGDNFDLETFHEDVVKLENSYSTSSDYSNGESFETAELINAPQQQVQGSPKNQTQMDLNSTGWTALQIMLLLIISKTHMIYSTKTNCCPRTHQMNSQCKSQKRLEQQQQKERDHHQHQQQYQDHNHRLLANQNVADASGDDDDDSNSYYGKNDIGSLYDYLIDTECPNFRNAIDSIIREKNDIRKQKFVALEFIYTYLCHGPRAPLGLKNA